MVSGTLKAMWSAAAGVMVKVTCPVIAGLAVSVALSTSLLAFADGYQTNLRRDLDPERMVTVELVDLTEEEAAKALLTLDPLAALAETDAQAVQALAAPLQTESQALR